MITLFTNVLSKYFNLTVTYSSEQEGGWSARAFKISTTNGIYFLKVYDKQRTATAQWTSTIDVYMPIVIWLNNNTGLESKILCPILTIDGQYRCEDEHFIYLLFPYIDGYTLCDKQMSNTQVKEIAEILAELHRYGENIPVKTSAIIEDFSVPFCSELRNILSSMDKQTDNETVSILKEYETILIKNVEETEILAQKLSKENLKFVLCHTDVHGWNLMQYDKLILIDWEGMKLAPPEADLFAFIGDLFWHKCSKEFIAYYKKVNPDFIINTEVLTFYQIRRRIEDICAFASGLLYENIDDDERRQSLYHLRKECKMLS